KKSHTFEPGVFYSVKGVKKKEKELTLDDVFELKLDPKIFPHLREKWATYQQSQRAAAGNPQRESAHKEQQSSQQLKSTVVEQTNNQVDIQQPGLSKTDTPIARTTDIPALKTESTSLELSTTLSDSRPTIAPSAQSQEPVYDQSYGPPSLEELAVEGLAF